MFTNVVGSATTTPAMLSLDTLPTVTTDPVDVSVITGHPVTFTASATGAPAPTVQWQVSSDSGVTFSDVTGATGTSYSFAPTLAQSGEQFRAVFTNVVGAVDTAAATLTVLPVPPLAITTTSLPAGSVYSKTHKVTYTATLTATSGNPPYKWSVIAGSLPTGLKLSSSKGTISGKATVAGTFTFTVQVVDKKGPGPLHAQNNATKQLSITITP